ncbi:MAG TPA: DNA-binding protein [Nitrosopumilaceae archaeon]|nr:DNA-binding protein [Nitrosopumilaceae archaeon]
MEEIKEENGQEQIEISKESVIVIHNEPVMESALDAISIFGKHQEIIIKATGNSIPNAVAVANIITENIMKGNTKIKKITVDSEQIRELGQQTLSSIKIILKKI